MESFIICYDLHEKNTENYNKLREKIKSFGKWARVVESTWIITSDKTAKEIRDSLSEVISEDDRIFVTKSSGIGAWHNTRCSNEWLKNNL
ncbi:CRISPR-associated protein Cas2 [Pectobacterium sp. CHL-2024]|uniref:CRISPR-associated protein Cas2 n=1 Tax=Pectobacterium sp. CHL-2024 TaxID=3377079 RepID=UPI00381F992C